MLDNVKIGVIGLGYVGLPLAVEFSNHFNVIGFDTDTSRIKELRQGVDRTKELQTDILLRNKNIKFTENFSALAHCKVFIITVPTPLTEGNKPDLQYLQNASELVAGILTVGSFVIYESTVYPGVTEEVCIPILEKKSLLIVNKDFFVGYSPERINPGDKKRNITDIIKITSGSNSQATEFIDQLYSKIIRAGTYPVSSIKVAEAAKVIENTQRDINIALVNELAMLFEKMELDTNEVLDAACTKWNFMDFRPGLVGGHCIGIDPYYLIYRAENLGFHPRVISAGRRVHTDMVEYISNRLIRSMLNKKIELVNSRILIMGCTFKENCPDTRNSKIFEVIENLKSFSFEVHCYDPWVHETEIRKFNENKLHFVKQPFENYYDAIIISVSHKVFLDMGIEKVKNLAKDNSIIFDLKNAFEVHNTDIRL